ncbi:MAG: PQQ-dependent sugar dehydrogenase [Bacteroidia bacterium]
MKLLPHYLYKLLFVVLSGTFTQLHAGNLPTGFIEEKMASGLNPVAMTLDHHSRIWVAEKHGAVRIIDSTGSILPDPVIQLAVDDYNERGLEGIALHPDFDNFPYLYLYYTRPDVARNRVSRFTVIGDLAVPGSEIILLELDSLYGFIHNGGGMVFGNDGMLYVATGEAANPPLAQNMTSLHGKILRIDPNGGIPQDNPFYASLSGNYRAIYAYGFRNPFSLTYDKGQGRLFATDVGSGEYEEINEIFPGKNYGWPLVEGPIAAQNPPSNYQNPLFAYDHNAGCAIVGAAIFHGTAFPQRYEGAFFHGDYCDGYINAINPETGTVIETFATGVNRPLAILFDENDGSMFYLSRAGIGGGSPNDNTGTQTGELWRVRYTGSGAPFISRQPESILVPVGESATFFVQAQGTSPFSYQWTRDNQPVPGAVAAQLVVSSVSLSDDGASYRCVITNAEGEETSEPAILSVTLNQRPEPTILSPDPGIRFKAGDTLRYEGYATDPEEGNLPAAALNWRIDWHHNDHVHPGAGPFPGVTSGSWEVPRVNETDVNVWYRVYLTATDSQGLSKTTYKDIYPQLVPMEINGPKGLVVNVDGRLRELPYHFQSVEGIQRIIQAPERKVAGDSIYTFLRWTNGHTQPEYTLFAPPGGTSLRIIYEAVPVGNGPGLPGAYYNDLELDLDGDPVFERIDSVIDFRWGNSSPHPSITKDYFTVRWLGEIQSIYEDEYTFYIRSDDGARLWIGDSLVIDNWVAQAPKEVSGNIYLRAGRKYPIRMEYMEIKGGSEVNLSWSSPRIEKEIVPQRQLYPPPIFYPSTVQGYVWLDENGNYARDLTEPGIEHVTVLLRVMESDSVYRSTISGADGAYQFEFLPEGLFYLQFLGESAGSGLVPGAGLDTGGNTPAFFLAAGETLTLHTFFTKLPEQEAEIISDLRLYPIPAGANTTVQFRLSLDLPVSVAIYNREGREMFTQILSGRKGQNQLTFPTGHYPSGIYHLRVFHPLVHKSQSFVKE